jgi:Amino acid synthesis
MLEIRKIVTTREAIYSELGVETPRPTIRAVGMAVIRNPFAGKVVEDLSPMFKANGMLGERLMADLVTMLEEAAVFYGKGAIVGFDARWSTGPRASIRCSASQCERRSAVARPSSTRTSRWPRRAPASMSRSATRTTPWSFLHFDTVTVSIPGAPRPDEIVVIMAIADGGRLHNRCGTEAIR